MSKQMVFLKYNFVFDSVTAWSHLSQFEEALADFFRAYDMEAEIIKTLNGQMGDRLMLISRVKMVKEPETIKMSKGIEKPKEIIHRMKKGGKLLPKVPDKPRKFSMNKGRILKGPSKDRPKLGGAK